jgi:hypothetical protein
MSIDNKFMDDWERNKYCITMTHYEKIIKGELKNPFSDNTFKSIIHIVNSIQNAENNYSDINESIINFEGYTGTKTRHFYNNLCKTNNVKYLEIGTWNGSSSISAVYKNKIKSALFIDNWCQFGGDSNIFKNNIEKYLEKETKFNFIENDCWDIDLSTIKDKFNIYLFDGDHAELDHFKALEYYLPVLEDEFIFIVDDLNFPNVLDGTMRAIRELNLNIHFRHQIYMSPDDLKGMPNHTGKKTWWNGCGIFLLSKPKN